MNEHVKYRDLAFSVSILQIQVKNTGNHNTGVLGLPPRSPNPQCISCSFHQASSNDTYVSCRWESHPESVAATSLILPCPQAVKFSSLFAGGPERAICGGQWECQMAVCEKICDQGSQPKTKDWIKKDDHQEYTPQPSQMNERWIRALFPIQAKILHTVFHPCMQQIKPELQKFKKGFVLC